MVCLQEIKAQQADLSPEMLDPPGYRGYFHCAEKKGYSGVAIYTRRKPENVIVGMSDDEFDREPADVGAGVAYLATREAEWVTGQVYALNGGALTA